MRSPRRAHFFFLAGVRGDSQTQIGRTHFKNLALLFAILEKYVDKRRRSRPGADRHRPFGVLSSTLLKFGDSFYVSHNRFQAFR
jgi:hypothetical protein